MHYVSFSFGNSKFSTCLLTSHPLIQGSSLKVFVFLSNKRGRKGMWSQPPQIKNILSLCVAVCMEKWGWLEEKEKQKSKCHAHRSERQSMRGRESQTGTWQVKNCTLLTQSESDDVTRCVFACRCESVSPQLNSLYIASGQQSQRTLTMPYLARRPFTPH